MATVTLKAKGSRVSLDENDYLGLVSSGSSQDVHLASVSAEQVASHSDGLGLEHLLDAWAFKVVQKSPKRMYTIRRMVVGRKTGRNYKKETLFFWHVGEGFTHAEGWWCNVDGED